MKLTVPLDQVKEGETCLLLPVGVRAIRDVGVEWLRIIGAPEGHCCWHPENLPYLGITTAEVDRHEPLPEPVVLQCPYVYDARDKGGILEGGYIQHTSLIPFIGRDDVEIEIRELRKRGWVCFKKARTKEQVAYER